MAFTIHRLKEAEDVPGIIADRKLWLTQDKERVVEDGDEDAAFLLAAPGHVIPGREAKRLGLEERDGKVQAKAGEAVEGKAVQGPAEDKAIKAPSENKGRKPKDSPPAGTSS